MRLVLVLVAVTLFGGAALADPILLTPGDSKFVMRAQNADSQAASICFGRVDGGEFDELACTALVAPGGEVSLAVSVPFTPGQDAEIRGKACFPPGHPGVHPSAMCSPASQDHYPVLMGVLSAPVISGPAP